MLAIRRAESEEDIASVQKLWTEYWETLGLPAEFQGFSEQLARLPGEFAPPGGLLLLAISDSGAAGTIAVRALPNNSCEAKRLYVPLRFRGTGLGRRLMQEAIDNSRRTGYQAMYADTLTTMHEAARLYEALGFERIPPYSSDPTPNAIYLRLVL